MSEAAPLSPAAHERLCAAPWQTTRKRWVFALFALLAGGLDALILIGWRQIDPGNLAWLRGDPAVYQAGWEFLRRSPWSFPPTWIAHLDYPFGISAAYLDVIPLVAVPLHLVAGLLPNDFQYLGAWAALCLMLQAWFACRLLSRFVAETPLVFLGALFFLNAPILMNRLYGHFSLASQWLIVAALFYYFEPVERGGVARRLAPLAVLAAIAGAITPYLAVMVLLIGLAAVLRQILEQPSDISSTGVSRPGPARSLLWGGLMFAAMGAAFLLCGFVVPGSGPPMDAPGYGEFSMNLLAPFDPLGDSLLFKASPVLPDQAFEGYNYLGLGIVILGLVALARRPALLARLWSARLLPLFLISLLFILLALSTRIVWGTTVLVSVPLPQPVLHALEIFRSSGRFFWPVYYLLFLAAIVASLCAIAPKWARYGVLAIACVVQYLDTAPIMQSVAEEARITASEPLRAAAWTVAARSATHLVVLPAWQCDPEETPGGTNAWPWFARLAARHRLTLNSVHDARTSKASEHYNCKTLPDEVSRGLLDKNTAYVLGDRLALLAIEHEQTHLCARVNGFNLCTFDPRRAAASQKDTDAILPPYVLGTEFQADRPAPRSMILTGFDMRRFAAIWTLGGHAEVDVRPVLPPIGDLRLDLVLGGKGALLTPRHPLQRVIVTMNGRRIGVLTFHLHGRNRLRSLVIPRHLVRSGQLAETGFLLPDAVAPSQLGSGSDGRVLGLYLSRLSIVSNEGTGNDKSSKTDRVR